MLKPLLLLRVLLFIVLVPGTVVIYIPYLLLGGPAAFPGFPVSVSAVLAYVLFALGAAVLLSCSWGFARHGQGTPAPIDPPRRLVVRGLYRFTRNPMYVGVLVALLSEAWLFHSWLLLAYAACVFLAFHFFVLLYEEPTLAKRFGAEYRPYCAAVPRWGIAFTPYRANDNAA